MKNNEKGWETSNVNYIAITDLQATTDKDDDKRGRKERDILDRGKVGD